MGYESDSQTIRERFNTQWPIEQPLVEHSFADVDYNPTKDTAWVRLNILTGEQTQVGMGSLRRFRRVGVVSVQIFVPAGKGDGQAKILADSVANIFMGRTVNGVIFRGTGLDRVGVDGAWAVWTANTPYQADDCVAIS
jgi:hypothetical protein